MEMEMGTPLKEALEEIRTHEFHDLRERLFELEQASICLSGMVYLWVREEGYPSI